MPTPPGEYKTVQDRILHYTREHALIPQSLI